MQLRIFFAFFILVAISCTSSNEGNSEGDSGTSDPIPVADGETTYIANCKLCHGPAGDLNFNGASDLTTSTISREEVVEVIKNGRKTMKAYKDVLTDEEIQKVSDYILGLRKN